MTPTKDPAATDPRTVAARIRDLEAERDQIDAAEAGDLLRAADDVSAWHSRDNQRQQRRVEIERSIRALQEWGALLDDHSDTIARYAAAARQHAAAVRVRTLDDVPTGRPPENGATELRNWWDALTRFASALPTHQRAGDDRARREARRVIAREVDQWLAARDAWLIARSNLLGKAVPEPETGRDGGLPDWLRIGAHRLDRLDDAADPT